MITKENVDLSFVSYSAPALIVFAERVCRNMKRNAIFANHDALLEYLHSRKTALTKHYNSIYTDSPKQIASIDQIQEEIIETLKVLAEHVTSIANNDKNLISSSGFYLAKQVINLQEQ